MLILGISFIPIMTMSSIILLIIQRQHLLMSLLALEGIILTLTLMIIMISSPNELFLSFVLLTMAACEASLGLACLVAMTRSYGNDHFMSLSINKC
uniref:NADH-ubiquinone oxidoreductase chain 4L n=1 Tax=Goniada japonica TaxID=1644143 RepID=A0A0F6QNU4_9ANNE|nr:NADH dehydrogenase subunit 4L [Goniada japonica]AKE32089.1 NADH dehydrogenase subunit 4L [Goniada japonica]